MKFNLKIVLFKSYRNAFLQIFLKIASLISPLILLPWALNASNPPVYGEYCALLALFNFMISLDLGIANLANGKVAGMLASKEHILLTSFVKQSRQTLNLLALFLSAPIFFCSLLLLDYMRGNSFRIFGSISLVISFIFTLSVYLAFLGNFGLKLGLAQQQNQKVVMLTTLQTLIPFFGFLLFRNGLDLIDLVFLFIFLPQLLACLSYMIFSRRLNKRYFLIKEISDKMSSSQVIRESSLFFFLQLANVISTQIDALIVALLLNSRSAAELAITWRFYGIPLQFLSLLSTPLWALAAAAKVNGTERSVILKLNRLLFIALLLLTGFSFFSFWCAKPILAYWTNGLISPGLLLLFSCSLWLVVSGLVNPVAAILNGLAERKFLIRIYSFSTIVNIGCSVSATLILQSNAGVLLGSMIAQIGFFLLPAFRYLRKETLPNA